MPNSVTAERGGAAGKTQSRGSRKPGAEPDTPYQMMWLSETSVDIRHVLA
jgi:hypothetical protein